MRSLYTLLYYVRGSDLCALYLYYFDSPAQILRILAAPTQLVPSTTLHIPLPLKSQRRRSAVDATTDNASAPIASGYPVMSAQEITYEVTPIIIYLQEFANNSTLTILICVLIYDTAASLHHIIIVLKHIQALTYHPTSTIIPYIKAINALFRKILHLLPFETSLATKLQKILNVNLLHYLRASTSTYFTTKHQSVQDAPYILQALQ